MPPLVLTPAFDDALVYAAQLHRYQWRKVDSVPYVSHLLAVAALVLEDGGSEAEAIAALFHDAVEDQGGAARLDDIQNRFGDRVAQITQACTEPVRMPGESWQCHKQRYFEQLRLTSPAVHRVTLADKLHNGFSLLNHLGRVGEQTWESFTGNREDIIWFYERAAALFAEVKPGKMTTELHQIVERLRAEA